MKTKALKFAAIPTYPAVTRDLALVMDKTIATYDVVRTIQKASKRERLYLAFDKKGSTTCHRGVYPLYFSKFTRLVYAANY